MSDELVRQEDVRVLSQLDDDWLRADCVRVRSGRFGLWLVVNGKPVGDPSGVFPIGKCGRDVLACHHVDLPGVSVVVEGT